MVPDQSGQFQSAHARHGNVGENEIDTFVSIQGLERLLSILSPQYAATTLLKIVGRNYGHVRVILDEQHADSLELSRLPTNGSRRALRNSICHWQIHGKAA